MASVGAKVEAAKAKKQHVFHGERVQAFSDTVFAIVATFAVCYKCAIIVHELLKEVAAEHRLTVRGAHRKLSRG